MTIEQNASMYGGPKNLKYELVTTDTLLTWDRKILRRIRALIDVNEEVPAGTLGGYVQGEWNLATAGKCWIYSGAKVYDYARVNGDAKICGRAEVFGAATITDAATVLGNAMVSDCAHLCANAWVSLDAQVYDHALITGNATITGKALVGGHATVRDDALVTDNAKIFGDAILSGRTTVAGDLYIDKSIATKATTETETATATGDGAQEADSRMLCSLQKSQKRLVYLYNMAMSIFVEPPVTIDQWFAAIDEAVSREEGETK